MTYSNDPNITLGGQDAAIVFRANGTVELTMPNGQDEELVPQHCMRAAACMVMLDQRPDLLKQLLQELLSEKAEQ